MFATRESELVVELGSDVHRQTDTVGTRRAPRRHQVSRCSFGDASIFGDRPAMSVWAYSRSGGPGPGRARVPRQRWCRRRACGQRKPRRFAWPSATSHWELQSALRLGLMQAPVNVWGLEISVAKAADAELPAPWITQCSITVCPFTSAGCDGKRGHGEPHRGGDTRATTTVGALNHGTRAQTQPTPAARELGLGNEWLPTTV